MLDKRGLLERVHLFSRCNSAELTLLARRSDVRHLPSGSVICTAGSRGTALWLIGDGRVRIERGGEARDVGPDAAIGELALVTDLPHEVTATTTADTTAVVLSTRELRSLLPAMPEMAQHMLAVLAADALACPETPIIH